MNVNASADMYNEINSKVICYIITLDAISSHLQTRMSPVVNLTRKSPSVMHFAASEMVMHVIKDSQIITWLHCKDVSTIAPASQWLEPVSGTNNAAHTYDYLFATVILCFATLGKRSTNLYGFRFLSSVNSPLFKRQNTNIGRQKSPLSLTKNLFGRG